jgi:hypothetical protein
LLADLNWPEREGFKQTHLLETCRWAVVPLDPAPILSIDVVPAVANAVTKAFVASGATLAPADIPRQPFRTRFS